MAPQLRYLLVPGTACFADEGTGVSMGELEERRDNRVSQGFRRRGTGKKQTNIGE